MLWAARKGVNWRESWHSESLTTKPFPSFDNRRSSLFYLLYGVPFGRRRQALQDDQELVSVVLLRSSTRTSGREKDCLSHRGVEEKSKKWVLVLVPCSNALVVDQCLSILIR